MTKNSWERPLSTKELQPRRKLVKNEMVGRRSFAEVVRNIVTQSETAPR